jgi:hypothetical protein
MLGYSNTKKKLPKKSQAKWLRNVAKGSKLFAQE